MKSTARRLLAAALGASLLGAAPSEAPSAAPRVSDETVGERIEALRSELHEIIRGAAERWSDARWSVLAVSLDRGDTLFAEGAGEMVAPASNMKLITTAAAIETLGADFRYRTFLLSSAPVEGGRLQGDLVLYGTGDPGISSRYHPSATSVFEAFADSLLAAGIHTVEGDVVGDGSYFGGALLGDGWNPADLNDAFAAPSAALSFNENVFQLRVRASGEGGVPEILTLPEEAGVPVDNQARIGGGRLVIRREHPTQPIEITGAIPSGGREVWRQMTVPDPAHFTASVFRRVLEARGVRVLGRARASYAVQASPVTARRLWAPTIDEGPAPRVLAQHTSGPIHEVLSVINKRSHNFLADQVLKTIGRIREGDGSFAGGARAVTRFLGDAVGADVSQLRVYDGSGLSALNRTSAAHFVSLLAYMADSAGWDALWETLPEAGNPRELGRMGRSPAAGNLRAKTGTIEHVSALSGMVRAANGERIAFSIIANEVPSTSRAKGIEDRIGTRLASFERPLDAPSMPVTVAATGADPSSADEVVDARATAEVGAESAAPEAAAVPAEPRRHEVARGENFSVIARRYGVSVDALLEANPEVDPRRLMPGMTVAIP